MLSLLLAADAVAKFGAAIGGSIAAIGAGIGLEKIGELRSAMIIAAALVEGVAFFAVIIALLALFV